MTAPSRSPPPHLRLIRELREPLAELRHNFQSAVTTIRTPLPFREEELPSDAEALVLECLSLIASQLEGFESRLAALEQDTQAHQQPSSPES